MISWSRTYHLSYDCFKCKIGYSAAIITKSSLNAFLWLRRIVFRTTGTIQNPIDVDLRGMCTIISEWAHFIFHKQMDIQTSKHLKHATKTEPVLIAIPNVRIRTWWYPLFLMDYLLCFVSANFWRLPWNSEIRSKAIKCYYNEFIVITYRYESTRIFLPIFTISQRLIDYSKPLYTCSDADIRSCVKWL